MLVAITVNGKDKQYKYSFHPTKTLCEPFRSHLLNATERVKSAKHSTH